MLVRLVQSLLVAGASILSIHFAHADTVLTVTEPGPKIPALEASNQAEANKKIYQCEKTILKDSGRKGKVKGAKVFFVASVKGDDKADAAIRSGKPAFKCVQKSWNSTESKFETVQ